MELLVMGILAGMGVVFLIHGDTFLGLVMTITFGGVGIWLAKNMNKKE